MRQIIEIKEKEKWNDFAVANSGDFLQSWEWGEFQENLGRKIFRLAVIDEELEATALIIKYDLPFKKSYLYCGRGPVIKNFQFSIFNFQNILDLLIDEIKKISQKESCIFFRVDPNFYSGDKEVENIFQEFGFLKSEFYQSAVTQPISAWQLDLVKEEQEIFSQMKEKARYNVRLAERKGVVVRESKNIKDLEKFYLIAQETAKRDGFGLHSKKHYLKLAEILFKNNLGTLFLAEHENDILSAIIVLFFNKKAIYLHGASSNVKRNLMANQLIQWQAIKEAKKRGCLIYDFGGISFQDKNWEGITRFKQGFGGKEAKYLPSYDLAINKFWYTLYKLVKRIK